jgi:hypothetical protein
VAGSYGTKKKDVVHESKFYDHNNNIEKPPTCSKAKRELGTTRYF